MNTIHITTPVIVTECWELTPDQYNRLDKIMICKLGANWKDDLVNCNDIIRDVLHHITEPAEDIWGEDAGTQIFTLEGNRKVSNQ